MKNFTIAIIGAGPGGYVAAIRAAQKGAKVALIESNLVGGVCLNEGCIPTKILLSHSARLQDIQESQKFHINVENISFDYPSIYKQKNKTISTLRSNVENLLRMNGVELIKGKARFTSSNTLQIEDETIQAEKIIIATGSSFTPFGDICFDETILSSSSLLNLEKLPKSLTIIGGGYIGCEFASLFAPFGVDITIVEAMSSIIPDQSSAISKELTKYFTTQKIKILTNTKVEKIEKNENGAIIYTDKNEKIESEKVLISIGRTCHLEELSLPSEINTEDGFISTNEYLQTTLPNVYAIGDVTGKAMLAHVASHQAIVAVDHILGKDVKMDYEAIPSVIFTHPQIASVGFTEKQAQETNIEIISATYPYRALGKAIASLETIGFAQIIADKKDHRILGAHIIGDKASELIGEITLAITYKMKLEDITKTIHAHPTLSEIWQEVAFMALDTPIHFPPKRR